MKPITIAFRKKDPVEVILALTDIVWERAEKVGFQALSEAEQTLFLIVSFDGEVNNGGFCQFFFNSSGDYTQETLPALKRIGATYSARLLKKAMSVFENASPDPDRDRRWKQIDKFSDKDENTLRALDEKYYQERDDIDELLANYARKEKAHFQ